MQTLAEVRAIPDAEARARAASELLRERETETTAELDVIRRLRDDAARAMLDAGARPADVARAMGVSRAAVAQRFGPSARKAG